MSYNEVVAHIVDGIEAVGVAIMVVGGAAVLARSGWYLVTRAFGEQRYRQLRRDLGRVILLGLEILIVADIVQTIIDLTLRNVAVLASIVAIRTVLSITLDIEIDGAPPWPRSDRTHPAEEH